MSRSLWISLLLGWALCAAVLLVIEGPVLHARHFWDALGCYVPQARFLAEHGHDLAAYRHLPYLRPPLFIGAIALALRRFGADPTAAHLITCLWSALVPPLTYLLSRQVYQDRGPALLAALLCALNPVVLAQAGIVQSDLPVTALTTLALLLLLRGQVVGYMLCGALAVLTKESAYFLSGPAVLWLFLQARRSGPGSAGDLLQPAALWRALPGLTPGVVLALWLVLQRYLVGQAMAPVQTSSLGSPGQLGSALLHGLVEWGRLPLLLLAAVAVAQALAPEQPRRQTHATLALGAGVILMPLCFPGSVVRYMLPSLPLLCVLASQGVRVLAEQGRRRLAAAATIGMFLLLAAGWSGPSWHANYGHHLEGNFAYRDLLAVHQQAAQAVADAGARAVLADFPLRNAVAETGGYGYLPAPLHATVPSGEEPLAELCRYDLLALSDGVGDGMRAVRQRLADAGALTLWRRVEAKVGSAGWFLPPWARIDHSVLLYRIRCPTAGAGRGA